MRFFMSIFTDKIPHFKLFFTDKTSDLSIWQDFCCNVAAKQKYCLLLRA